MMKKFSININGYIEGYYGQLLKWSERYLILKKLKKCKFNTYFYCPKEDIEQRLKWRDNYKLKWLTPFKKFCLTAKNYDLNILVGISPGLDFNFKDNKIDREILIRKTRILKENGASQIVLMFDDIKPLQLNILNNKKTEGTLHAELANYLSNQLGETIFVVPRIYADELIENKNSYLNDFFKTLNKNIPFFYCGKKIISDTNNKKELSSLEIFTSNRIIFWDNLYANDYCPMKLFIGPYFGRSHFNNTMINPTGMIKTDLFILDLIFLSITNNDNESGWRKILEKYKMPYEYNIISKYFFPINYNQNKKNKTSSFEDEISALDFLLWKWKTKLSREWYPYLLILKQSLQLFYNDLDSKRTKKIFPVPLSKVMINQKGD